MGTDKHGRPLAAYPETADSGRLVGVNAFGNAAYATDESVSLALLDEAGTLRVPPRQRRVGHEFPLDDVGLSPGEYVLYVADEYGPWRGLSDLGRDLVRDVGADPDRVVGRVETERDADALVGSLRETDDWAERSDLAAELRWVAMDRPDTVAPHVTELLPLLEPVEGSDATDAGASEEREREQRDSEEPEREQREQERVQSRALARRDVGYAVARAGREDWTAVAPSFERLVGIAGEPEIDDPTDEFRFHLVDLLDARGHEAVGDAADRFATMLADDDPTVRRRTLNALHHLEYRYATGTHPLLECEAVRDAVEARLDDPDADVRERADAVETLHEFHE